jgi:hypothetical protein
MSRSTSQQQIRDRTDPAEGCENTVAAILSHLAAGLAVEEFVTG